MIEEVRLAFPEILKHVRTRERAPFIREDLPDECPCAPAVARLQFLAEFLAEQQLASGHVRQFVPEGGVLAQELVCLSGRHLASRHQALECGQGVSLTGMPHEDFRLGAAVLALRLAEYETIPAQGPVEAMGDLVFLLSILLEQPVSAASVGRRVEVLLHAQPQLADVRLHGPGEGRAAARLEREQPRHVRMLEVVHVGVVEQGAMPGHHALQDGLDGRQPTRPEEAHHEDVEAARQDLGAEFDGFDGAMLSHDTAERREFGRGGKAELPMVAHPAALVWCQPDVTGAGPRALGRQHCGGALRRPGGACARHRVLPQGWSEPRGDSRASGCGPCGPAVVPCSS